MPKADLDLIFSHADDEDAAMSIDIETIIRIALEEFAKVFATASKDKAVSPEVEEVEELPCGNYLVTLGYWSRDSKPGIGGAASKPTKAGLPPIQFDDPLQTTKKQPITNSSILGGGNTNALRSIPIREKPWPSGCMNRHWVCHESEFCRSGCPIP